MYIMMASFGLLLLAVEYFIIVVNGENGDSIQRQSVNAKYLKVQDAHEEVATSLTCWQCAALPSMNRYI